MADSLDKAGEVGSSATGGAAEAVPRAFGEEGFMAVVAEGGERDWGWRFHKVSFGEGLGGEGWSSGL